MGTKKISLKSIIVINISIIIIIIVINISIIIIFWFINNSMIIIIIFIIVISIVIVILYLPDNKFFFIFTNCITKLLILSFS